MIEKIGNHNINWRSSAFVSNRIATPVDGIVFVTKRRYPSHSKDRAAYFQVESTDQAELGFPTLIPIYRLGFRRAWRAALIALGGRGNPKLVRFARRAPPIESFVKLPSQ